jgi:hypothetical protein
MPPQRRRCTSRASRWHVAGGQARRQCSRCGFRWLVNGVRFESSGDCAFNTDQTTYRAILRADGAL